MVRNGRPPPDSEAPAIFGRITYVHRYRYKTQIAQRRRYFLLFCLVFTADVLLEPLRRISIGAGRISGLTPCKNLAESLGVLFLVS